MTTVRGKNKRNATKFYISHFYRRYENYIWGGSNLYRCASTPNILGLHCFWSSRYRVMTEISTTHKWVDSGGLPIFPVFAILNFRISQRKLLGRGSLQNWRLASWLSITQKNNILIAHIRHGHFPLIIENVELHAGLHKSAVILVLIWMTDKVSGNLLQDRNWKRFLHCF